MMIRKSAESSSTAKLSSPNRVVENVASTTLPLISAFTASVVAATANEATMPVATHTFWRSGVRNIAAIMAIAANKIYNNIIFKY